MSILVIGDVMLDRYWSGEVSRLSQEAPVPVVKMDHEERRAGAAANVAANCASLGGDVALIGIVGRDESADLLNNCVANRGIDVMLVEDITIKTTQKLRVIGRSQQIVRVDFEQRPSASIEALALEQIKRHDIIVFSDYGKGSLVKVSQLIRFAKATGKTVLVDPKGHDYAKYAGADAVKPNRDELREMAGGWSSPEQMNLKAQAIRREAMVGAILVTLASDGMAIYDEEGVAHIPAIAQDVYDVTGAGDTVMAAIAVMLGEGKTLREAAVIANYAAGVVIGKFGTSTVSKAELEEAMAHATC
jgi:rfaE bifunctional protein kinase chain/domain